MIPSRTSYAAVVFITILAVAFVVRIATATLTSTVPPGKPTGEVSVERVEAPADVRSSITAVEEPAATQVTQQADGLRVIEVRCSQCHVVQQLRQIQKSSAGWEETLVQMEALGVQLGDNEKTVLIDYLTNPGNP